MTTRRKAMAIGATALCHSCRLSPTAGEEPRVFIAQVTGYEQSLFEILKRHFQTHAGFFRGKSVVLKPNLVEFDARAPINTHPMVVHAALEACRAAGASSVRIAEGPGHRRDTLALAESAGYFRQIPGFESLFTDLNVDDVAPVTWNRPVSGISRIYLPVTILQAGAVVSIAKMKTHHWAGATLTMKNLFGIVPGGVYGWPKNVLHWAGIHECIVDLARGIPNAFGIVDGITGMEGNGPIQGRAKDCGVVVMGRDLAAVDATSCRVMGIDPAKVPYLQVAASKGQVEERFVRQTGASISAVRRDFALIAEFADLRLV